jgi:hypothetical protein
MRNGSRKLPPRRWPRASRDTHTITDQTRLRRSRRPRTASRHDICQSPLDRRASTKTIAEIGRQRRRLSIRRSLPPGTLLDAPVELAYSDHGPNRALARAAEPARERRRAVARLPVRSSAPRFPACSGRGEPRTPIRRSCRSPARPLPCARPVAEARRAALLIVRQGSAPPRWRSCVGGRSLWGRTVLRRPTMRTKRTEPLSQPYGDGLVRDQANGRAIEAPADCDPCRRVCKSRACAIAL